MKAHEGRTWTRFDRAGLVLIVLLATALALYNLDGYPALTSMDEGHKLQFPKNLVSYGRYALRTFEGFSPFGGGTGSGAVNTGVTLMLPVALAFRILGVNLWAARLPVAMYLIGASGALYLCVRSLYGGRVALLAYLLFLLAGPPWLNTMFFGRSVYGEVPALAFFFLGSYLWFRSLDDKGPALLIAASICFGLASLTKDVFAPMLTALFGGMYVLDRMKSRHLQLRQVVLPVVASAASVIGWRLLLGDIGGAREAENSLWDGIRLRFLVFSPHLSYESLKFLAEHGAILWIIPSLVHVLIVAFRSGDSKATIRCLFHPLFVMIWFSWYVLASIGWHRYAYPGWAVASIPVAKFLCDLARAFRVSIPGPPVALRWREPPAKLHRAPALLLIGILVIWPAQNSVRRIIKGDNDAPDEFAQYIEANVPQDALIASEEWEIDFFSNRSYFHHPGRFGTALIKHQLGHPLTERYDVSVYDPDYVVDGPYGRGTTLISREFLESRCRLVVSIGDYDLYQVTQ